MTTYKARKAKTAPADPSPVEAVQPSRFQTPAVTAALDQLRRRYPGDVPPLEEVRRDLEKASGGRTAKELLDEARGK